MHYRRFLGLSILLFCFVTGSGQTVADSLKNLLSSVKDTARVSVLVKLAQEYSTQDPAQSLKYSEEALQISKSKAYPKGQADAYHYIGLYYKRTKDSTQALSNFNKALQLRLEIQDTIAASRSYNSIGDLYYSYDEYRKSIKFYTEAQKLKELAKDEKGNGISLSKIGNAYFYMGKYDQAMTFYQRALKVFDKLQDYVGIASCQTGIGNIYQNTATGDTTLVDQALKYHRLSLETSIKSGNKPGQADAYNNIGNCCSQKGNIYETELKKNPKAEKYYSHAASKCYSEAIENYGKSLEIRQQLNDKAGEASALNNIGGGYINLKQHDKALDYFKKSLAINESLSITSEVSVNLYYLGKSYLGTGQYELAIENYRKSLDLALGIGFTKVIMADFEDLSEAYRATGNYKAAYECMDKLADIKDSTLNAESRKNIAELTTQYETEKKEQEIKLLTVDRDLKNSQYKQQQMLNYVFIGGLLFIGLILLLIIRQYREKKKANLELQQKNELITHQKQEITDSIMYARRIQLAILPPGDYIMNILPERFIFYKPRDIVSGDFYWLKHLEQNNLTVATAADCTGHGVPGAMMSMLGVAFLNEIVNRPDIKEAGQILDALRENIIKSLHQTGRIGEAKDGMDISLVVFDNERRTVQFAGANNPLYLIRNNELKEIKGDKMPIGIHDHAGEHFVNHVIPLEKGDCLYLFSDGFPDQFGGERGKKFMYKRFKEFLISIHQLPMDEQHKKLEAELHAWQGSREQVDDVLVLGFRIR